MNSVLVMASGLMSAVQKIKTESALNPVLWALGILVTVLLATLAFDAKYVTVTVLAFIGLTVVLFIFSYAYLMLKDPNRLQSERFQLTYQKNQLMLDDRVEKDSGMTIDVTPTSNNHISPQETGQ